MITNDLYNQLRTKAISILEQNKEKHVQDYVNDVEVLIEELNIHRIELEMQNQELRESQQLVTYQNERYHLLYDNAPVGYFTFNNLGNILEINTTAASFLDSTVDDIMTYPFLPFIIKEYKHLFFKHIKTTFSTNIVQKCEIAIQAASNKIRFLQLQSISFYDSMYNSTLCRTTAFDTTDLNQAKIQLIHSEEKFAKAFHNSPELISISTVDDGRYIDVNQSFLNSSGYSLEEIVGYTSQELNLWVRQSERESLIDQIKNLGAVRNLEVQFRAKSGKIQSYLLSAELIFMDEQNYILTNLRDITELLDYKQALEESELKLRTIAENIIEVLWLRTSDKMIYVSPSYTTLFGKSYELIYENPNSFFENIHPDDVEKLNRELESEQYTNSKILDIDLRIIGLNEQIKWIHAKTIPINNQKYNNLWVGVAFDITQTKETEQKLMELNLMKDQLFSIISHDLRNPFNAILGFIELSIKAVSENKTEKIAHYLQIILNSAKSAFSLTENLLEWSRMQIGKMEATPQMISPRKLSEESLDLLNNMLDNKQLSVFNSVAEEIEVFCDKNMISTVFRNLITNAVKYSFQGKNIYINCEVSVNEPIATFTISDEGTGINPEELNQLFSVKLKRSKQGTKGEKGTGLGLILCKDFIEKNGGSILIESTLGKGTKVIFTLPVKK